MGEAARRKALSLPPRGIRPAKDGPLQRHVLALMDRRITHIKHDDGTVETKFEDHSAKPNVYCSADMKTLYRWDGIMLRRLDRLALQAQTKAAP